MASNILKKKLTVVHSCRELPLCYVDMIHSITNGLDTVEKSVIVIFHFAEHIPLINYFLLFLFYDFSVSATKGHSVTYADLLNPLF